MAVPLLKGYKQEPVIFMASLWQLKFFLCMWYEGTRKTGVKRTPFSFSLDLDIQDLFCFNQLNS